MSEEDIESLYVPEQTARSTSASSSVVTHNRAKHRSVKGSSDKINFSIPGTQSVFVKTYGCAHNVSDSEYMSGLLQAYGYQLTTDVSSADCVVINSCTVKDPSQAAFVNMIDTSKKEKRPLVVCGCVPQSERNAKFLKGASIIGVQQIDRVVSERARRDPMGLPTKVTTLFLNPFEPLPHTAPHTRNYSSA